MYEKIHQGYQIVHDLIKELQGEGVSTLEEVLIL